MHEEEFARPLTPALVAKYSSVPRWESSPLPRKINPKYGVDPVQEIPPFSFTEVQTKQLLAALSVVKGDRADIIAQLEKCSREYLWLRNQYRGKPTRAQQNAALKEIAQIAEHLSKILSQLDMDTEWDLTNAMVLQIGALTDIADRLEILAHGAKQALRSGKKRSGPRRTPCVDRVLPDLVHLYEEVTGRHFTHNPYRSTEYIGTPQSSAGKFFIVFFEIVDPAVSKTSLSSAMAALAKTRHARTKAKVI